MSYEYHEERYLSYQQRLDNKEYRSPEEKAFLQEQATVHQGMAAGKLSWNVLAQLDITPIQKPFFPQFGDN